MKKIAGFILLLLLAAYLLVGCSSASAGAIYGKDDTNIYVGVGETFTIQLEENPTTGYSWVAAIADEKVLSQVSSDYEPEPKDTAIVGSGGMRSITFRGLEKGSATITLTYERSWEKENPAETIVFNITVK